MFVSDTDTWTRPQRIAKELGLKLVVTNDVHFPLVTDAAIHPILTGMKAGMSYNSKELWLKSPIQIIERGKRFVDEDILVEAMNRAYGIGDLIQPAELKRDPWLPHIEDADEKLHVIADRGYIEKGLGDGTPKATEYLERLRRELAVIQTMGYSTYFLILHDVIRYARSIGCRVGPGRGSGAGSLTLWLLNVTEIDPIKYGLSFERFLHEKRKGFPDVDIDFDSDDRGKVIEYAEKTWGAHPVATYSRYAHSSLVHDLAKMFRLSREDERIAAERGPKSEVFKRITDDTPLFGQSYEAMIGQIRHKGKHAGGVIITDRPVPVERVGHSLAAAWTDGHDRQLSYAGIVKFDFLGLTALSALKRMENEIGRKACPPGEDDAVLERFRAGDLVGIFQFSGSSGIAELTRRVSPHSFEDMVAINALYRPGALDVGSADSYPDWKIAPRKFHPVIDDILEPTYGAIVYQEQVMEIFARVTDGSLADADMARRAIIKSKVGDPEWERSINDAHDVFLKGADRKGIDIGVAHKIWDELFSHVRYSFNKAHAVSYCAISWDLAWWKLYHTALFFATMMDVDSTEFQTYLFDAVNHGLEVKTPHINRSSHLHRHEGNTIYLPLSSVKHLGYDGAKHVSEERAKSPFLSYKDLNDRVKRKTLNSRARKALYLLGGFEGIDGNPIDAGIDTLALDDIGEPEHVIQQKYLGAMVPSAKIINLIESNKAEGLISGIVVNRRRKESKFGVYEVHYLIPEGIFWTRDLPPVAIGKAVAVKTNPRSGKALKIQEL
jgi:DNA polymerase-3 subunit alpha